MTSDERITRQQLEDRFQVLQSTLHNMVADRKTQMRSAMTLGGLVLLLVTYMLGRRRGNGRHGILEIRRG